MAKHTKSKKKGESKIKGILVIIVIEAILLIFIGYYSDFSRFIATDENTEMVVLRVDEVDRPYSGAPVYIYSNGVQYKLNWSTAGSTTVRVDAQTLSEAIQREDTVIAYIKDGSEVVGLQGEETTYLTVDDYNRYQTKNCTLACIAYAIFQLLHIAGSYWYIRF